MNRLFNSKCLKTKNALPKAFWLASKEKNAHPALRKMFEEFYVEFKFNALERGLRGEIDTKIANPKAEKPKIKHYSDESLQNYFNLENLSADQIKGVIFDLYSKEEYGKMTDTFKYLTINKINVDFSVSSLSSYHYTDDSVECLKRHVTLCRYLLTVDNFQFKEVFESLRVISEGMYQRGQLDTDYLMQFLLDMRWILGNGTKIELSETCLSSALLSKLHHPKLFFN